MPYNLSNLSVLTIKPKDIRVGIVQSAAKNSKYLIKVGNMTLSVSSTVDLLPKQRVVIGKSTEGWVVLTSEKLSSPTIVEVKITG